MTSTYSSLHNLWLMHPSWLQGFILHHTHPYFELVCCIPHDCKIFSLPASFRHALHKLMHCQGPCRDIRQDNCKFCLRHGIGTTPHVGSSVVHPWCMHCLICWWFIHPSKARFQWRPQKHLRLSLPDSSASFGFGLIWNVKWCTPLDEANEFFNYHLKCCPVVLTKIKRANYWSIYCQGEIFLQCLGYSCWAET